MRRHLPHRLTRTAVTALVVCGVAVAERRPPSGRPALAGHPRRRDRRGRHARTRRNLVSPDARAVSATPSVDLRSADARSAAIESTRGPVVAAPVQVDRVVESSGFDWSDFLIGVAAAMAMVLLGFAALSLAHRGRTGGSGPSPLAS